MNAFRRLRKLALMLCISLSLLPLRAGADDIDIFVGGSAGSSANPNVLIVLDNTSNWARQSQQWPGGLQQGQSEARAIQTAINALGASAANVNVGLMEFVTGGNANDQGGFIRSAIRAMSGTSASGNLGNFNTKLTTIFNGVNSTNEKRNSNTPYGDLMYDVYNYFAGAPVSKDGSNATRDVMPPNPDVDASGYTANYSTFKQPLSSTTSCAHNFVIFIGNPNSSGPAADSTANTAALAALGGNTKQLPLPNFTTTTGTISTQIGKTAQCLTSAQASGCTTSNISTTYAPALAATCADTDTYPSGCSCGTAAAGTADCAVGTNRYSVIATTSAQAATVGPDTIINSTKGTISGNSADWTITLNTAPPKFVAGMTVDIAGCPTSGGSLNGNGQAVVSISASASSFHVNANKNASACTSGTATFHNATINASTTNLGYTSACYASQPACGTGDYTAACASYTGGCACGAPTTTIGTSCAAGTSLYNVLGSGTTTSITPTGTYTADISPFNADEWSRFMFQTGVPVTGGSNQSITTYTIDVFNAQQNAQQTSLMMSMAKAGGGRYFVASNEQAIVNALKLILAEIQSVNSTFASASLPVNATNRTQNANQVFIGMFRPDPSAYPRWFGNLKQYAIGRPNGIDFDLVDIHGNAATNGQTGFLADCTTSWWTSSSPTPDAWGRSSYWNGATDNPPPTGRCPTTSFDKYSDSPDGSFVEKGAVAEVLRKGNVPPYADTDSVTPTWSVNRTLYTCNPSSCSGAPVTFNATNVSGLSANALNFTRGVDVNNDTNIASGVAPDPSVRTRPSIHGDVIHSRPLPINYGSGGVTVYYGANDGTLRSVDSASGKEVWAFIAPEFASAAAGRTPSAGADPLTRLMNNSPLINYSNVAASLNPLPKDYFFDGSFGVYQNLDNSKVWIYPTMRRGGRMIYAFDVTNRAAPSIKWRRGCPDLTDDSNCVGGGAGTMTGIGQTWSTPNIGFVKGYSLTTPVVFVGGGYDVCEDADTASPSCGSAKGRTVYALDGDTGDIIATFPTTRSVAADIALVDVDNDGYVDYAYAADTGGNLYRIDLSQYQRDPVSGAVSYTSLAGGGWTIHRVAYTNGGGRKFLFAPVLFPMAGAGKVFVGVGSGDREHPLATNYPFGSVVNRFYMYLDSLNATAANNMDDVSVFDDFTSDAAVSALIAANGGNCTANNFGSGKKGWFMSLNQYGAGEQTVTSGVIAGGVVYFSTNRPIPPSSGSCSVALGEARGYALDIFNASGAISTSATCGGTRSNTFAGGGLPPSPVVGTVPVEGVPTTVCIGCVSRDCTGSNCSTPFTPGNITPNIVPIRKRVYQYSSGADNK